MLFFVGSSPITQKVLFFLTLKVALTTLEAEKNNNSQYLIKHRKRAPLQKMGLFAHFLLPYATYQFFFSSIADFLQAADSNDVGTHAVCGQPLARVGRPLELPKSTVLSIWLDPNFSFFAILKLK